MEQAAPETETSPPAQHEDDASPPPYSDDRKKTNGQLAQALDDIKQPESESSRKRFPVGTWLGDVRVFAFGPNGMYFFVTGAFLVGYSPITWDVKDISQPFCATMGENVRYFITCKGKSGDATWAIDRKQLAEPKFSIFTKGKTKALLKSGYESDKSAEARLADWTSRLPHSLDGLQAARVVFGPGTSFYAFTPGDHVHHRVPQGLLSAIAEGRKRDVTPNHVALGVKDTWFVLFEDRTYAYDFKDSYPFLRSVLDSKSDDPAERCQVAYLALNAFHEGDYLLERESGLITYSTVAAGADATRKIRELASDVMQKRAVKDNVTFSMVVERGTLRRSIYVGPETKHEFDLSKWRAVMDKDKSKA